jgi:hypothetical protein
VPFERLGIDWFKTLALHLFCVSRYAAARANVHEHHCTVPRLTIEHQLFPGSKIVSIKYECRHRIELLWYVPLTYLYPPVHPRGSLAYVCWTLCSASGISILMLLDSVYTVADIDRRGRLRVILRRGALVEICFSVSTSPIPFLSMLLLSNHFLSSCPSFSSSPLVLFSSFL